MAEPVQMCTHVKTDGVTCGSPAISGTRLCYHHSAVKMALGKAVPPPNQNGAIPIPFVFPEDRASMQIDFFLLLQAFNQQQIDVPTFKSMMSMLKAMRSNLGKTGTLVDEDKAQGPERRAQEGDQRLAVTDQSGSEPTSQKRDPSASSGQVVGHPHPQQATGAASEAPFEFSPELMAKLEEVERLDPKDPSYAERIRAAVAEGTKELRAQGIDLIEIASITGSSVR